MIFLLSGGIIFYYKRINMTNKKDYSNITQNGLLYLNKSTVCDSLGVFTSGFIAKGAIVEVAPALLEHKMIITHTGIHSLESKLKDYIYNHPEEYKNPTKNQIMIALGYGSLYNHSEKPNLGRTTKIINKRYYIEFTALRDINKDEELFHSYNYKTKTINTSAHKFHEGK